MNQSWCRLRLVVIRGVDVRRGSVSRGDETRRIRVRQFRRNEARLHETIANAEHLGSKQRMGETDNCRYPPEQGHKVSDNVFRREFPRHRRDGTDGLFPYCAFLNHHELLQGLQQVERMLDPADEWNEAT